MQTDPPEGVQEAKHSKRCRQTTSKRRRAQHTRYLGRFKADLAARGCRQGSPTRHPRGAVLEMSGLGAVLKLICPPEDAAQHPPNDVQDVPKRTPKEGTPQKGGIILTPVRNPRFGALERQAV